jgi:hypothetical protein
LKESTLLHDWRTIQLFLGEDGVAEVEVDSLNPINIRCTCPKARCAHVKFVKKEMQGNHGQYTVSIPVEVEDGVAEEAMTDAKSFRDFIIRYGKVEVI